MRGAPVNAVLLAAGRGSRLSPLTDDTHKSLLPLGGAPVLSHIFEALLSRSVEQVVVVTGDKAASIEGFVDQLKDARISTVHNARFAEDTNVLSTELGVQALRRPELGYLIVETDLFIEQSGWERVLGIDETTGSFWVTRGHYSPSLTGGALHTGLSGEVDGLVYAPRYDAQFEGWAKLVGLLYVGPREVEADRALRQQAISETLAQYYMTPWTRHLARLPCSARSLDGAYAASFNDLETYRRTEQEVTALLDAAVGSRKVS